MARQSDFVTLVRQHDAALIGVLDALNALRREWDSAGYSGTMPPEAFEGSNSDVTEAEIAAVIGTTLDAINALLAEGHGSNLYAIL